MDDSQRLQVLTTASAEVEFPGCTLANVALQTIWRGPGGGWPRKHLVAEASDGRVLMWDDGARLWCTVWSRSTWTDGGFVQHSSREWLTERLSTEAS